ncbi:transcriptional regulator [Marinobacterium nitratireducens]|uniref:Transcriptional regulator n=1 Tax=Marinobacterium nitratireducens TaxID=518897 RepID=A0A917Z9V8_9GAMM|nr:LysR family transcriptional regulator [Marinobacterium nitratireducens]GGO79108.1 transcriptional regulator [Marinobacterium nitratireducens]
MRLQKVDLNLFPVFEAIYAERNLTRAAERLCLSQPAVSNALGRLRDSLDDPLFVRTPRAMVPTPVAESMIGYVREALHLLDTSVQLGDRFEPGVAQRSFKLSMHDVNELVLLPRLLALLQKEAPGISLSSFPVGRQDLAKELASGQLDLAIDVPTLNHSDLRHCPLISIPYVCVVRRDHPAVGDSLSMEQYLALSHLHISNRREGMGHVDLALSRLGFQRNIQMRNRHHLVAPKLIEETDLALTVPLSLATNRNLKVLELPFAVEPVEWHLYWHRSADQDKAHGWLREVVLSLVKD